MSTNTSRIVCTGCDYETSEVHRPILVRYQRANGETVETGRSKGWCFKCSGYADIEKMDRDALRDSLVAQERARLETRGRLAELRKGLFWPFRNGWERKRLQFELEGAEIAIAELVTLLEMARLRKANARCLSCWSDDTSTISFSPDDNVAHDFKHACGGNLKIIHSRSGNRYFFQDTTYILNEEGELLGKA